MSLALLQRKAQQLRAQKRQRVIGSFVAPAAVAFFYVFCIKLFPHLQQTAHFLFAFALAWSAAGAYFLTRGLSLGEIPQDAGFATGLEFCRGEIKRQLGYFRHALLWSFGPIIVAMGILVTAIAARVPLFPAGAPFLTVAVVWMAAYLFIRARQQRDLVRELDELNEIARATSGADNH